MGGLGRHVAGRADDLGPGERAGASRELRHAEVEDFPCGGFVRELGSEEVLRLEIAVHDAGRVRDLQRAEDLEREMDRSIDGEPRPALGVEEIGEFVGDVNDVARKGN